MDKMELIKYHIYTLNYQTFLYLGKITEDDYFPHIVINLTNMKMNGYIHNFPNFDLHHKNHININDYDINKILKIKDTIPTNNTDQRIKLLTKTLNHISQEN